MDQMNIPADTPTQAAAARTKLLMKLQAAMHFAGMKSLWEAQEKISIADLEILLKPVEYKTFDEWLKIIEERQFAHDPAWQDGARKGWDAAVGIMMQYLSAEAKHSAHTAALYSSLKAMLQ